MKLPLRKTSFILVLAALPVAGFGQPGLGENDNLSCTTATLIDDSSNNTHSGNFLNGALVTPDDIPPCANPNNEFPLRTFWYKFYADGIRNYFLVADNMVGSLQVFAGSCDSLVSYGCTQSDQGVCYAPMTGFPEGMYYVRLAGYSIPGFFNFDLDLTSVDPTPPCDISLDDISFYPCVNGEGQIPVTISGSLTNWEEGIDVYVEIGTDESLYFTTEIETGDSWTANLDVTGTEITHVYAFYGNAENPCSSALYNIDLPTEICDSDEAASLRCTVNWGEQCYDRSGEVWVFDPGTANLRAHYDVQVQDKGRFEIDYPILGTYDVIVKIKGFLPKGFSEVAILNEPNSLNVGNLTAGELNGDRFISIHDISAFNNWFNLAVDPNQPEFDLNCDGAINTTDISVLNAGYGLIGAGAPLDD